MNEDEYKNAIKKRIRSNFEIYLFSVLAILLVLSKLSVENRILMIAFLAITAVFVIWSIISIIGILHEIDFNEILSRYNYISRAIKAIPENVRYSKCPNCGKYGIPAWIKIGKRRNPTLTCIYCEQKYRVNSALSIIAVISIAAFWGLLAKSLEEHGFGNGGTTFYVIVIAALICFVMFDHFAPVEKLDEPKK